METAGILIGVYLGLGELDVEMGEGTAKGIEFLIQKTAGKTTGWLAYTLAKTDRLFPDGSINPDKIETIKFLHFNVETCDLIEDYQNLAFYVNK